MLQNTRLTRTAPIVFSDGWSAQRPNRTLSLTQVSRPAADRVDAQLVLVNTLPDPLPGNCALCFQTKNERVRVWAGDRLVYAYADTPQRVYGHGVGAIWNFAALPEEAAGESIVVELTPTGGRTGLAPYRFLLGERNGIQSYLLRQNLPLLCICILLAVIGLGMFVMWILYRARGDAHAAPMLYFALFVLLAFVWTIADSGLLQFVFSNKGVIYLLFGCSFYILCVPFALFMAATMPARHKLFNGFAILIGAYAVVRILLYAACVMNFEAGLWLLHLLMSVLIVTINVTLWAPIVRGKPPERLNLLLAVTAFTLVDFVSLISFYANRKLDMLRNGYSSGFYFGILLFGLITFAGIIRQGETVRQQAFKAAFYERRAYNDDLTGLLNGKGFDDKCAELLRAAPPERYYAIVDFDVNFFSQYNATNGPSAGDELLKRIADTLRSLRRDGEIIARQEADHFVCMVHGDSLDDVLLRIRESDQNVRSNIASNMLLISYGVAEITDRSVNIPTLRNEAAVAKHTVKGNYENNIAVYDHGLHERQLQEVAILSGFARALEHKEYVIYLQPKIEPATERIGGAEALVRRIESDGSVVPAGPIIEILERKGFITKLDYHVLERVCAFLAHCIAQGRQVVPISSNFSRVHLYDSEFPAHIAAITDRYNVPRALIEIELTETAFLVGKDVLQSMVRRLHEYGFLVAIDDFGSGYSSLNMLKDVEADVIKLDREFLEGFGENSRADTIIAHTLRLAQQMRIKTVAEGIERADQLAFLRALDCDYVQGYYYSRPLPEDVFIERYLPIL